MKKKTCIGNIREYECILVRWMKLTKQRYPIVECDTSMHFWESVKIVKKKMFRKMPDHFILSAWRWCNTNLIRIINHITKAKTRTETNNHH